MLVIVCVWAFSTKLRSKTDQNSSQPGTESNTKTVKCDVCGVYMPLEQAGEEKQGVYLCEQHRG